MLFVLCVSALPFMQPGAAMIPPSVAVEGQAERIRAERFKWLSLIGAGALSALGISNWLRWSAKVANADTVATAATVANRVT